MFQADDEVIIIVIAGTIMLLLLGIFIISFLFFYQNKHNLHIAEQEQLRAAYSQEMLTTRLEVQEQTLNHISQELHDNIGQVLSFIKLNLGTTGSLEEKVKQKKIDESRDLLSQVIADLRSLAKSLSFQQIVEHGLLKAINTEVDRVNKSGLLTIDIQASGEPYSLGEQRELVLFRIFQEGLNNTLKYAHARKLSIRLMYAPELFNLTIADDGVGFSTDTTKNQHGSGLKNMESRAALIGATFELNSVPGNGSTISVEIDPNKELIANGQYSHSAG
ncbi:histidine kinase [Mucilaginibacter yixingensis]|uniref:Histidine kinase n=1 Tax=Mucilaginibacter yixingensis TaxID=1295612 RepID=A0A2T5JD81_9SPHI|nr:sensor histidine kinase [Mucilaginibacter yixingensis]PTQ99714.1 histidine kinase [Mucilaginibacter yixingensis]